MPKVWHVHIWTMVIYNEFVIEKKSNFDAHLANSGVEVLLKTNDIILKCIPITQLKIIMSY